MLRYPTKLGIGVLASLFGWASMESAAQTPGTIRQAVVGDAGDSTHEISTEQLEAILARASATVLDARPYLEYAISHIPGAVNVSAKPGVPISLYVSDVADIGRLVGGNKTTPLVLYCNGPHCGKSKRSALPVGDSGMARRWRRL